MGCIISKMKIFNFLKKSPPVEEEIREIGLDDLDLFVDSLSEKIVEGVNLELVAVKEKIILEKEKILENIQKLNEAKIKNPDIPERVKQIAEGNRKMCIQKINVFLQGINPPNDFSESRVFCDSFDKSFELFDKGTVKSYQVLPEFFPDEVMGISLPVKNLSDLSIKVKKLAEDAEIEKYDYLKKQIGEVKGKIAEEKKLKEEIEIIKEAVQTQVKKLDEKEVKVREIELGNEYEKFLELSEKRKILESKIKIVEKKQFNNFIGIEVALKKYERLTLDYELVKQYLADPLKALLEDKELKIIEIIEKIKKSILKEELELKDQKKKRILKELEEFTREDFEMFFYEYAKLNEELKGVNLKLGEITIVEELEGVKEEFNQDKNSLEENKGKVEKMKGELGAINIDNLKRVLEVKVKESINENVKVV
jgi:hypothetical protein